MSVDLKCHLWRSFRNSNLLCQSPLSNDKSLILVNSRSTCHTAPTHYRDSALGLPPHWGSLEFHLPEQSPGAGEPRVLSCASSLKQPWPDEDAVHPSSTCKHLKLHMKRERQTDRPTDSSNLLLSSQNLQSRVNSLTLLR